MRSSIALTLCLAMASSVAAQDSYSESVKLAGDIAVTPDVTYLVADGHESKLDVYAHRDKSTKRPTVIYIHGGGWVGGNKDTYTLAVLPYLHMGFAAVNVGYRLGRHALAPGAVEDARCALRWVHANAETYGFDTDRIVVTGHSAGGHLSLTTGMLPASAGLDRRCPARDLDAPGRADTRDLDMKVAAVVNWFGITDVGDLLDGKNAKTYAVAWLGSLPDRMKVAERVSPLSYVRADLPAILTLHGDADTIVPYSHATRLHEMLESKGASHRLHTISGGGHGGFTDAEDVEAYDVIREFLREVFSGKR